MLIPSSSPRHSRKVVVWAAVIVSALLLIAAIVVLYVSARLNQQLVNRTPDYSSEELYSRAVEQVVKGEYDVAEEYLEQALRKDDDPTFRGQLAVVKYRLGKYQESIDQYGKLIEDGRDASFAWNGVGNAYRDWAAEEPAGADTYRQEAVRAYRQAITLNSGYIAAYSNLALLYHEQGNVQAALEVLDQGIGATNSEELRQVRQVVSAPQ